MKNTLWQTVSVFISSTFRDMHSERDILIKQVFPRIRERLTTHRIRLIDIDLRWGITAEQAENDKTIEFCLDSIEGCRPFFIGILGERYGWIPESAPGSVEARFPHTVAENGNSITAMEIIHGVLAPPDAGVKDYPLYQLVQAFRDPSGANGHALFFFRDPSFEREIPEPFKHVMVSEGPEHKRKLELLRERIRMAAGAYPPVENYPCRFAGVSVDWDLLSEEASEEVKDFIEAHAEGNLIPGESLGKASPEVEKWLAEHATVTLDHLEEFAAEAEQRLWSMLCEAFPALNEPADREADPHRLEDEAHQALATELNTLFIGRDALRSGWADSGGGSLIVLSGQSGSGKSALLARLTADWQELHPHGSVVVHFSGATASGANPDSFFNRILRKILEVTGQTPYASPEPGFFANALRAVIERISEEHKILIAIDGIDRLYENNGFDFRWIPDSIPSNTTILLTLGDDHPQAALMLSQLSDCNARFLQIPALRVEEREEMIRLLPAIWAKTMDKSHIGILAAHPASNLPLFLTIALDELRKFGSFERLEKRIQRFPSQIGEPGLIQLYGQMLERLERELGRQETEEPLRLLALSESGLSESEIAYLCEDTDPRVLSLLWRSLRIHLIDMNGLLGFYHVALRKAILQRYLNDPAVADLIRRRLAGFFSQGHPVSRSLPELLSHHYSLGDTGAIRNLLTRLPYLTFMRKNRPGELSVWWDRAEVENPLKEIALSLPEQVLPFAGLLAEDHRIALGFWTPATGSNEILLYKESEQENIVPLLDADTRDALMEIVRMIEESRLRNNTTIPLSVKLLALMTAELGPVHARTLETLATAIPQYFTTLDKEDLQIFLTRVFMTVTSYLPDNHPVSVRVRMQVQDFFRAQDPSRSFRDDFDELIQALDNRNDEKTAVEEEADIPFREIQHVLLRAVLLTRHSQMLRLAGNTGEALEFCIRTLEYCRTNLGPFHELSIQALNNLAMIHMEETNDPDTGMRLLKETLAMTDSRVGRNSYLGLVLVNNLAAGYGNLGRFEEGLTWYQDSLERKLQVLGPDHPSTLHSRYNLAWCYRNLNRLDEAISHCREVIEKFIVLGDEYLQEQLQMKVHLVEFLDEAGNREEASQILEPVIDLFYSLPEEQQSWRTYSLISGYLSRLLEENNDEQALWELWDNTLSVLLPHEAARSHVNSLYQEMNQWLTSRVKDCLSTHNLPLLLGYLDKLIDIHERLFGPDNESLLHWKVVLGETYNKLLRYDEAEPLLRDTMNRLRQVKGPSDPETRVAAAHLAKALLETGRGEEGSQILMESMEAGAARKTDILSMLTHMIQDAEAQFGEEHPKTLQLLDEAAQQLMEKERFQDALPFLQTAFSRSERAIGPLERETLKRAGTLASTLMNLDQPAEAEPVLRRIVQILEQTLGLASDETMEAYEQHGNTLVKINEPEEAIAVFRKAVSVPSGNREVPDFRLERMLARLARLLFDTGRAE